MEMVQHALLKTLAAWAANSPPRPLALALLMAISSPPHLGRAEAQEGNVRVVVPSVFIVEPEKNTPLAIHVSQDQALPPQSFIRISGLNEASKLSVGHQVAPGSWAIAIKALPNLQINAPLSAVGNSDLTVALVNVNGQVISSQIAKLVVAPAWLVTPADPRNQQRDQTELARSAVPPVTVGIGVGPTTNSTGIEAPQPRVAISPNNEARALKLLDQGRRYLELSNFAVARQYLRTAAELNYAPAALLLARTFDPDAIADMTAPGLTADVSEAIRWYQHAKSLGAPEADSPLARLTGR